MCSWCFLHTCVWFNGQVCLHLLVGCRLRWHWKCQKWKNLLDAPSPPSSHKWDLCFFFNFNICVSESTNSTSSRVYVSFSIVAIYHTSVLSEASAIGVAMSNKLMHLTWMPLSVIAWTSLWNVMSCVCETRAILRFLPALAILYTRYWSKRFNGFYNNM